AGDVLAAFLFEARRGVADRPGVSGRGGAAGIPDSRFAVHDRERGDVSRHSRFALLARLATRALHHLDRPGGPDLGFLLLAKDEQSLPPVVASRDAILFPPE